MTGPDRDDDELRGVGDDLRNPAVPPHGSADAEPAVVGEPPEDLDDLDELAGQRRSRGRWILAAILVVVMLIPLSGVFVDEFDFGRSADEVRQQVGTGDPLLDAVLLVRTVACDGQVTTGSAFALDLDGEVVLLTNRHVVERANSIGLRTLDGGPAIRVNDHRVSLRQDVAVLSAREEDLAVTPLSAADRAAVGQSIRIVGFPGGRPSATDGTISDLSGGRVLLDVAVQQGSSGSPVVDGDGDVVAIVTARTNDGRGLGLGIREVEQAARGAVPPRPC